MVPWKTWIHVVIALALFWAPAAAASPDRLVARIKSGGHVLMIRHAHAPGTGDPDYFQIGDCATQRNLNDQGVVLKLQSDGETEFSGPLAFD